MATGSGYGTLPCAADRLGGLDASGMAARVASGIGWVGRRREFR